MTIARGQMKRQLYNEGSPNKLEQLDISPEERALLEKVLEKDSMEFIRESDDDEVMEMLMLKQKGPNYQYNEKNPYTGPRDMRMGGGIMSVRQPFLFGGVADFISSAGDAIGGVFDTAKEGVESVVGDIGLEEIAAIAALAAGVPPQFVSTAYGASGGDNQLFQTGLNLYGGYSGGQGQGGTFGFPQSGGGSGGTFGFPQSGGGIFDSLSSISQFMPMEGPLPTGQTSSGGGIFDGIDPRILEAGMKIGTNYLGNKLREKQEEKNIDQAYNYLKSSYGTSNLTDAQMRAIKIYGGAAVSAALAKLAYESQQQQLEQFKQDREAYEERRKAKAAEYAAATRPEVTGRPETTEDVVARPTAAMGGIMGSRKSYMMGTEVPLRQNQAGITEMDFRESGGFVPPIGIKEKADDIPAMLSNNEFVFTADAVRAAGGGSVDKGAQKMYALMKQLEGQA